MASINEHPDVCATLELKAPQTEDQSQGLEVSYTDQILISLVMHGVYMYIAVALSHETVLDPLILLGMPLLVFRHRS